MNARKSALWISVCVIAVFAVTRAQSRADADVVTAISNLQNDAVKADLAGDSAFYQKVLAEDWTRGDSDGSWYTKADLLKLMADPKNIKTKKLSELKVRVYGNTAVATYKDTYDIMIMGQHRAHTIIATDTYVQDGERMEAGRESRSGVEGAAYALIVTLAAKADTFDHGKGHQMSKNNLTSLQPFVQGRSIENSRWYMGNVMTFLVNGEQTDGAFSMTEYLSKPGNEPPAHVHSREDEFLYVLEGRIDAYIGKDLFSAGENEGVYFPNFIPHTFKILSPQLRMLIWISPGGFEGYFRYMSEPARSLGLPEHAVTYGKVDMECALRTGKERGISFLSAEEIRQQMPPLAKSLAF